MNKPLLGPEGLPIVAGEDYPNDDSERCEGCGEPLGACTRERCMQCPECFTSGCHEFGCGLSGSSGGVAITPRELDPNAPPSSLPAHVIQIGPVPLVATRDGVFVGAAHENHARATQSSAHAPRVTSVTERVQSEIRMRGMLAELIETWDESEDSTERMDAAIERARALLREGE